MTKFDACHDITAKWEGGFSDHKADPGGKTNWGITQATLSAHLGRPATGDEIRSLTKERAKAIYAAPARAASAARAVTASSSWNGDLT